MHCTLFNKNKYNALYRLVFYQTNPCQSSQFQELQDEFHFLCVCQLYQNKRVLLYDGITELHLEFASLIAQEKFVYQLRYENREVATYLEKAYNNHKYHLYE